MVTASLLMPVDPKVKNSVKYLPCFVIKVSLNLPLNFCAGSRNTFSCKMAICQGSAKTLAEVNHQAIVAWTNTYLHEITVGLVVSFPVIRTGFSGKANRVSGGLFNIPKSKSRTASARAPICFLTQFPQLPEDMEEKWIKVQGKIFLLRQS